MSGREIAKRQAGDRHQEAVLTVKYIGREVESVSQLDTQEGTAAAMALSPEDVRYLRHWEVSIRCLLTPGPRSGIRNKFFPDPGSRIPNPYFLELRNHFFDFLGG